MKALQVGADGFRLEAAAAEDVIAIVGRRGRGKTTTAVVLVEELHDAGGRFCVADPVGVWWGLKSSKDGRSAGIPVVVMGGEHSDVPLEDTAGRVIADFVADPTGPSVVLDFRGFRKGQMTRFMTDFLEQLYHRNRAPLHLVLDEADQFAPQRVMSETARLVGAAEDVCKMGRAKGLHPIVITQRPAAINKNVLTQAGLLVAHALTGPQDQKAVDEWIRANADEAQRGEFMDTIAGLAKGVAWFWQPEIPIFQRVQVRNRETFDSSATPKRGEARAAPKVLAEVDLEELKKRIAGTIEKAKAEDPRELRAEIVRLKKELAAAVAALVKGKPAPASTPPRTVEKKVPAIDPKVTSIVSTAMERLEAAATRIQGKLEQDLRDLHEDLEALSRIVARRVPTEISATPAPAAAPRPAAVAPRPVQRAGVAPGGKPARPVHSSNGDATVSRPQMAILDALAYFESIGVSRPTRRQLALVARVSAVSSGYEKNVSTLRTAGLVDYPGPNLLALTATGRAIARTPEVPPSVEELHEAVCARVSKPQSEILRQLIKAYPDSLSREDLAQLSNQSETSSGFEKNVSTLKSLGLVGYPGPGAVAALPVLFLEG